MFTRFLSKIVICFLLCVCLIGISTGTPTDSNSQDPNRISEHKELYDILEIKEDATDNEIIQLLDLPVKCIYATALIRHKRISSATPKLLQIVNDNETTIPAKLTAAEALCDFGNKEWMPTIKALSTDPNGMINRTSHKYKVAGLLARAGDFSQFEVVAKGISDSKDYIRSTAIYELGNFGHKTDPVTDSAVELLTSVATSDSIPWLRERAIESMEKIAKTKPEVEPKVIAALEANKDSSDENLRIMCNAKLDSYNKKLKKEKSQ
jgi:hypothetical protein